MVKIQCKQNNIRQAEHFENYFICNDILEHPSSVKPILILKYEPIFSWNNPPDGDTAHQ